MGQFARNIHLETVKLLKNFNAQRQFEILNGFTDINLSESQFAQILGKAKLYNAMPNHLKHEIPRLGLTDSQLSLVAEDYYLDTTHCRNDDGNINLWKVYNLFTGANKTSYIDTFLDRHTAILKGVEDLYNAIKNQNSSWYLN